MKIGNRIIQSVVLLSAVLLLSSCVNLIKKNESMQSQLRIGNIGNAFTIVEREDSAEKDVLASMNKGMLRQMKGDYKGSNAIFEVAKNKIEKLYGVSVTEQAGALIVNDTLRSYFGDRYEQVLLHAYMAMNYIKLDDLDSARVEMLQADVKMQEWGEQPEEDPFVRYLSGVIYEALGEKDQALVAYRKAKEAYQTTKQNIGIPGVLKKDLLRLLSEEGLKNELRALKKEFKMKKFKASSTSKKMGELVVVLSAGLAPVRGGISITVPGVEEVVDTVKIALPRYYNSSPSFSARLSVRGASADLELVEDVDALARAALDSDLPIITARAVARAVVKHKTQKKAEDKGGPLMGFLATVTNVITEQADTRSWTSLPQTIQLTRVNLPAGQHDVNIEIHNASGSLVDTIRKKVTVQSGKTAFLTERWVVPNMSMTVVSKK